MNKENKTKIQEQREETQTFSGGWRKKKMF